MTACLVKNYNFLLFSDDPVIRLIFVKLIIFAFYPIIFGVVLIIIYGLILMANQRNYALFKQYSITTMMIIMFLAYPIIVNRAFQMMR